MTTINNTSGELLRALAFDTAYLDYDDYPDPADAPEFYFACDEDEDLYRLPEVEEFGDWEIGPTDWE